MSGRIAARCATVTESVTVRLNDRVKELRAQGVDILDAGGGDPDFDTPAHVTEAAARAMDDGFTHYTASRGLPELRTAIAAKLLRDNGVAVDADTGVLVTPSSKHALFVAFMALLDPGDELLVPTPSWVSYQAMARLAGAVPVSVPLSADDGFALKRSHLEEHVTPRTKALVLNTPNNPTGRILTPREAAALEGLALDHDLLIVTDEIYEKLVLDGARHFSIAGRPRCADRTVTVNGFSKAYAMPGWRLGWAAGPPDLVAAMLAVHQHTVACAGSFVQSGGLAALTGPQESLRAMADAYADRARLLVAGLNALPGVSARPPSGTFYVLADIRATGLTDTTFAARLLSEAAVAVTPGSAFGPGGEGHVRLSLTNPPDVLKEILARLAAFLRTVVPSPA